MQRQSFGFGTLTYLFSGLLLMSVIILSGGCSEKKEATWRIGVSQCSDDIWRTKMNDEIYREVLFHPEVDVEIRTADDDNARQIADIEHFIEEGVDVIIAAPNQAEALTPVLSKAYRKGIPVIVFDRGVTGDDFTAFIEFDNEGIGRTAAEYAASHLHGGGTIAEITGLEGSTPAALRHKGFVSRLADFPALHNVASVSARWKEVPAGRVADSLIRKHPDIRLIYAHNDLMAIGAAKALKKAGREDVMVLGTDAAPALGIKAVADSVIDATFIYPTDGHRLVKTALDILQNRPFDKVQISPALPPVDSNNADIMLRQYRLLDDETNKIRLLQSKYDDIWSRHRAQSYFLYSIVAIALLLGAAIFMAVRVIRQRTKYQNILTAKNAQLSEERDKQDALYKALDEATKSKLVFFTNVSHDLRTPLTLIAEPVERLAESRNLSQTDRGLMKIAVRNVRILRRMIDQILDFRKYENGRSELHLTEVNMQSLFREWADSFLNVAGKRDIGFSADFGTPSDFRMAVDVEKIERIFFNLMSNAFKFTPSHGCITLECRQTPENFIFSIEDTGSGIAAGELEKIFERFYQVDRVNPKGSGIGLALARAFAEMHGGGISVESTPGKGSRFTVTIPVIHVSDEEQTPEVKPDNDDVDVIFTPPESGGATFDADKPIVLAIDDNPDILSLVGNILGNEYNVIKASDGRKALGLATRYVPDLIICDLMMPRMDGLECCAALKKEVSTSHIPVLMLTACQLEEQRVESYDSGADGYITKPFSHELLTARCRNLLENRRRIRELYDEESVRQPSGDRIAGKDIDINDAGSLESEFYRAFLKEAKARISDSSASLEEIASRLGLGPAQMSRKLKALTGLTASEILRNLRLKMARELLLTTDRSISEIAYESGFSSPAYLSKCFRDCYGTSPSELRNSIRKD
ncbi:MAG: substrate-binding domain-containing protein [Muribaculaceae bacterium]|nr:substrate-binding domain-containing protein [Muribaculaceae bacterium]